MFCGKNAGNIVIHNIRLWTKKRRVSVKVDNYPPVIQCVTITVGAAFGALPFESSILTLIDPQAPMMVRIRKSATMKSAT